MTPEEIKSWIRDIILLCETDDVEEAIKMLRFLYENID
jgi:hypothetical protein